MKIADHFYLARSKYGATAHYFWRNCTFFFLPITLIIMPRVVQPGGLSGKMRVRYTARRKLALLASVKRVMEEEGLTLRMAAERLRVAHSLFVKWEALRSVEGDPILAMLKTKVKANHPGPASQLKPIEVPLLRYIFEQREQGMADEIGRAHV